MDTPWILCKISEGSFLGGTSTEGSIFDTKFGSDGNTDTGGWEDIEREFFKSSLFDEKDFLWMKVSKLLILPSFFDGLIFCDDLDMLAGSRKSKLSLKTLAAGLAGVPYLSWAGLRLA